MSAYLEQRRQRGAARFCGGGGHETNRQAHLVEAFLPEEIRFMAHPNPKPPSIGHNSPLGAAHIEWVVLQVLQPEDGRAMAVGRRPCRAKEPAPITGQAPFYPATGPTTLTCASVPQNRPAPRPPLAPPLKPGVRQPRAAAAAGCQTGAAQRTPHAGPGSAAQRRPRAQTARLH